MDQNFGPTTLGVQESGWLYRETKQLQNMGVKITYSGDSPFLNRLVLGISSELSSDHPSHIPVYVSEKNFLPTSCSDSDGKRTSLEVPFRQNVPKEALSSIEDIRTICPDATHMIARCVENDIKRVAQKLINDKHPYEDEYLERFQENLTSRDAKRPTFQFSIDKKNPGNSKIPGTVGNISLAGSNALTIIAGKEELAKAKDGKITDLYDGVWMKEELLIGSEDSDGYKLGAAKILKALHPHLFDKEDPKNPSNEGRGKYMSIYDACELLRNSLNQCAILLRRQGEFDVETYKHWAETYYQINLLLFGQDGLSPYKLKIPLIAKLVESGYIERPWNHLCEGMEKSNHNANRNFQSRTMRGGGKSWHQDPLYLDIAFSFCRFLDISASITKKRMSTVIGIVKTTFPTEETLEGEDAETMTWQKICSAPLELPRLAVGESREFGDLMRGLRFLIVGYFNKITEDKKNLTQDILKGYIRDMGGFIYDKDQAEVVMRNHSDILNFYVVIQNEEQLINATGDKQEIEDMRMKLNLPPNANQDTTELTTDAESTSVKRSSRGRTPKRTVNQDNTVTKIPPNANQDTTELITDAESTSIKRSSRGRPPKRTVNQDNTATKIPPKNEKGPSTKNSIQPRIQPIQIKSIKKGRS